MVMIFMIFPLLSKHQKVTGLILIAAAAHELADDGVAGNIVGVQRRNPAHHLHQVCQAVLFQIFRRQLLAELGISSVPADGVRLSRGSLTIVVTRGKKEDGVFYVLAVKEEGGASLEVKMVPPS
jgi:hypothetical protein